MSTFMLITADDAVGVLDRSALWAAMRIDLRDLLPNNLWQKLRVESAKDSKAVELFVGPVAVHTMLQQKAKFESGVSIVESAIALLFETGIKPVVCIEEEGETSTSTRTSATIAEIVNAARMSSRHASFLVRPELFRCRAEVRLRAPLSVGATGATANAFFRNCDVVGVSERDLERILRKEAHAEGNDLIAVHDAQIIPLADVPNLQRGVMRREGRVYF